MIDLATVEWMSRFQAALNASEEFRKAARWFDGSVVITVGKRSFWFKIYAGKAIDLQKGHSVFGHTFGLRASPEDWEALCSAPRNEFHKYVTKRRIEVDGNLLEFLRLTRAVTVMTDVMRAVHQDQSADGKGAPDGDAGTLLRGR